MNTDVMYVCYLSFYSIYLSILRWVVR